MIRITGGRFRGRQIHCPKGKNVRPTTAFVRESLFSILGSRLPGARFLDLYAGSGIVGLEALSRGAAVAHAVEGALAHCRILEKNRALLALSKEQYRIDCQTTQQWLKGVTASGSASYDIVYCDPPYAAVEEALDVIQDCFAKQVVSTEGVLVLESALKQLPVTLGAFLIETRQYGSSTLFFFTQSEETSS